MARRGAIGFFVILVAGLVADQLSKLWARTLPVLPAGCPQPEALLAHHCRGVPQPVIEGTWDWQLAYNPGVAFSTFAGRSGTQVILSVVAAVALIVICVLALRTRPEERWKRAAFALIASGALGNLIDRVRDGAVTDFIAWHAGEHHWPLFNVADAALLVGAVILLISGRPSRAAR